MEHWLQRVGKLDANTLLGRTTDATMARALPLTLGSLLFAAGSVAAASAAGASSTSASASASASASYSSSAGSALGGAPIWCANATR